MDNVPPETASEIRQRFCELVRILEAHGVAWDYALLIDLDLYIISVHARKRVQ